MNKNGTKSKQKKLFFVWGSMIVFLTFLISFISAKYFITYIKENRIKKAHEIANTVYELVNQNDYITDEVREKLITIKENNISNHYFNFFGVDVDDKETSPIDLLDSGESMTILHTKRIDLDKVLANKTKLVDFEIEDLADWELLTYTFIKDGLYLELVTDFEDIRILTISYLINVSIVAIIFIIILSSFWKQIASDFDKAEKFEEIEKQRQREKQFAKELAETLAKTVDLKDKYTNGHSFRVAKYTALLSKQLGYNEDTVDKFYEIALLHDIGKIGIPDEILNKPGPLTKQEYEVIKTHTSKGYELLKSINVLPEFSDGAGFHHERWDGKGYPKGLKENEIPRVAQIIAVADAFDAMYSDRPYRKKLYFQEVIKRIQDAKGKQFSPDVVDAFNVAVYNEHWND